MTSATLSFERDAILKFWLGDNFPSSAASEKNTQRWFFGNSAIDTQIRERFGNAIEVALDGGFDDKVTNELDWLALLILLDQFPRNVFRGSPRAFAGDGKALALALAGIACGYDQLMHPMARLFCYLPLEHSEDIAMQGRAVSLFQTFRDQAPADLAQSVDGWLDYAIRHRDVIARFGRFPHRNAVLGRNSTSEELAYLDEPGSGF